MPDYGDRFSRRGGGAPVPGKTTTSDVTGVPGKTTLTQLLPATMPTTTATSAAPGPPATAHIPVQRKPSDVDSSASSAAASSSQPARALRHLQLKALPSTATAESASEAGGSPVDIAAHGVAGGGEPLPHLAQIQSSFGHHDVSGVAAHQGPAAANAARALGASAFAVGHSVAFDGAPDLHTAAHEAAHVVQQRSSVQLKGGIDGGATDLYERHADQVADAVVAGQAAAPLLDQIAGSASAGSVVQRTPPKHLVPDPNAPALNNADASDGATRPEASVKGGTAELTVPGARPSTLEPAGQQVATPAPIQRQRDEHAPKQRVVYKIQITRPMTGEEFKVAAHMQMFGAVLPSNWHDVKDRYTPADGPVEIDVDIALVRRGRGAANAARGIDTDATGAVAGAAQRAKDFNAQPSLDKVAVMAEIDRRYYATSGEAAGTKVRPSDAGRGALWRSVRDEVLFERAYLGNLPDKVKAFIRTGIVGRDLTPADYEQLFRIAKAIEGLPAGQAADCAAKITASTTDLGQLEATIERYRDEMTAREKADQERTAVHNQLAGLEGVYQLYRQYLAASASDTPAAKRFGLTGANAKSLGEQLEQMLKRYGFASIAEFAASIARYERAFEEGATAITLDLLARYAGKLHRESQRYQDPAVVQDLYRKLGGFRAEHQELDKQSQRYAREIRNAQHERDAELRRLPGNGGTPTKPPTHAQVEAKQKADAANANAEAHIKDLSTDYPIFAEDDLPSDKRLDKVALAQASATQLAGVLQAHIANRQAAVADARGKLEGKHELVYRMPKLLPTFYAQLGIQPGSIHDRVIQDKIHDDTITKVVDGILLALVAIALTVVSFGAATPAVVAAGASIGAAGLSTYMAYDEYKQYAADHAIAQAGFAHDPSVVWLVLAIVGAGVDMGAAVGAVGKLAPAARLLAAESKPIEAEAKLIEFTKAVDSFRAKGEIDDKVAAAADKAAAARTSYAAAKDQFKADLKGAASRAASGLGPFTDPTLYRGLLKMAAAKIREGVHSLDAFIAQLKQARIDAQLGEMAPEELVKVKAAWAEAEGLSKQVNDPVKLEKLLALDLGPGALEKFADLDVKALERFATLSRDDLQKLARLRYADMLAKFGACDVEGLAKLATLDRAVLEKFGGWDAGVVKNISGLAMRDIEKIAKLKVAPGQALEGALATFRAEQFRIGSEVFQLDKRGMAHILERHHPQYWDGSVKLEQSFLDPGMTLSDVQDAVRAVIQQNRELLIKQGTRGAYRLTGTYNGQTYVLGVANGRVGQFYPR